MIVLHDVNLALLTDHKVQITDSVRTEIDLLECLKIRNK